MKTDDVLRLVAAGFTADEIRSMEAPAETQEAPAEAQEAPAEDTTQEAPTETQEVPQTLTEDDVKRLIAAQLKQAQQAANARTAERDSKPPQTAQDVLKHMMENY